MEFQFHGANCITVTYKGTRIVIDDNLQELGAKSVIKAGDAALYTTEHDKNSSARLTFDSPGEYEISDISVVGIAARSHMDEEDKHSATMIKLMQGEHSVLITGHIYPELSELQQEEIGMVDIMFVPVGGNGYTVDPIGAAKLIKDIEPKIVIPTHYNDKSLKFPMPQQDLANALKELAMEPKETISKLKLKTLEQSDVTQLLILEKS